MSLVLDTHAVVWYLLGSNQLAETTYALIDGAARGEPTYVSAVSVIEIIYLLERQRISVSALNRLADELSNENPSFVIVPVDYRVAMRMREIPRNIVPDMRDRIIAATALCLGFPLVTRDRRIQAAGIQTIWK